MEALKNRFFGRLDSPSLRSSFLALVRVNNRSIEINEPLSHWLRLDTRAQTASDVY